MPAPASRSGDLWSRADVGAALRSRSWAAVFVAWRDENGASQSDLAALIGLSQPYVSAIERGERSVTALEVVERIVEGLEIPWSALGIVDKPQDDPTDVRPAGEEDDDVRRREFLGFAATLTLPSALVGAAGGQLGEKDIARYRAELDRLDRLESAYGGRHTYAVTAASATRLRHVRETSSMTASVTAQLDRLIAESCYHAGWAAFDLDNQERARFWWLDALHSADLAGDESVPTMVYAAMSMQARKRGHAREAVTLAQRAQRSAAALPRSRRLWSFLHAREAAGHALAGDRKLSARTYVRVEDIASEKAADDPDWLDFWGVADLAAHRYNSARDAGDLAGAERAARDALEALDGDRWPRNHASYLAMLAGVLVEQQRLDEALPVVGHAVLRMQTVGSERIAKPLRQTLTAMEHHKASPAVAGFLEWARANPDLRA